jgi:multiple antibiotic resistance protein
MIENFLTAFIVYFVVIDPIGTAPIFLAVTAAQDKRAKIRTAIEATLVATLIMVFFALCGSWVLRYLQIGEPAFKIAGGVILFLVAWDMLTSKRQARKRRETTGPETGPAPAPAHDAEAGARTTPGKQHTKDTSGNDDEPENVAIFPLAIPMLAGPAAIMSVMVVSADFSGSMVMSLTGYGALLAVMLVTGKIMVLTAIADRMIDPRLSNVFSRVTAIILAALSVQYVIDGLTALQLIAAP